jgi:triosephosphate isomerase
MNRRPIVAGNIKMYLTIEAALELGRQVWRGLDGTETAEVLYFPPYTAIADLARVLRESPIAVGGQNMHPSIEGAFTGEISPRMLLDAGAGHVLIGHSERRTLFGETDDGVRLKTIAALEHGLRPVVCVGETLEEREGGRMEEVLARQVREGLRDLDPAKIAGLVVAYEPVWAIGTGRTATPEQANEAHGFLRGEIAGILGRPAADGLRILYGGSVKPDNAESLLSQSDVDGALVGGACLRPDSFLAIIRAAGRSGRD